MRRPFAARRVLPALVLAALGAAALAAPARAGTFRVSQCASLWYGTSAPRGYQTGVWWAQGGLPRVDCGTPGGRIVFYTPNHRLAEHQIASLHFTLPPGMPGSSLRTAWLAWHFNPQGPSTNPASLNVMSAGASVLVAKPGEGSRPSAPTRRDLPLGARGLEAQIWCSPVNGRGWCNWPGPQLEIRGVTFEAEEYGDPTATASGALVARGEHAGVEPLELAASDGDSGVRAVAASLADTAVGTLRPAGGCRDDRLPPCPQSLRGTLDVDTRSVPDGPRRLRLVVTDAAGNERTVDAGVIDVRNHPTPSTPPGPPAPSEDGGVPVAVPPPLFPANPLAGRGHVANGSRADGRAHVAAWLESSTWRHGTPLRRRTATVPPGVRVRIRGRLTDRRGRPIARAALAAIRREDGGAWKAITGVRTRPNGRFTAFTRIGPSQHVQFVYYAFGDSRSGRRSPRLHVRVRRE